MAIYAIGDVQGCRDELQWLLERLRFDPQVDRLWFAGDLVNRGPDSLGVLRLVKSLGESAVVVLGNHDLHLLALAAGNAKHRKKSNLDRILWAPDGGELLEWLRRRSILHHDEALGISLVHAGLPPQWTLAEARACAAELERVLRGPGFKAFMHSMYGNQPNLWSPGLAGVERLRYITNCFTRLRYVGADGRLLLKEKSMPGAQPAGVLPWYLAPKRKTRGDRIVFGHWSALGYNVEANTWSIDSGCLWGGKLTALRLSAKKKAIEPIHLDCAGYLTPGG